LIEFTINRPFKMLRISSANYGGDSSKKTEEEKQFYQALDPVLSAGDLILEEFYCGCSETLSCLLKKGQYDFIYFQSSKDAEGQCGIELNIESNQNVFLPLNDLADSFPQNRPPFLVVIDGYSENDQKEAGEIFTKRGTAKTLVLSEAPQSSEGVKIVSEFFKELVGRMKQDSIAMAVEESLAFVGLDGDSQPTALLCSAFAQKEKIVFKEEAEDKHPLFNMQEAAEPSAAPVGSQRFIGRWDSMARVENAIESGAKAVGVFGDSGLGKTFFVHQLGTTLLTTMDETFAVEKIFFLDGGSHSDGAYGELMDQLEKLFHRFSENSLTQIIRNQRDYPEPKAKAQALIEAIKERSFLFVFDNFESWLDDEHGIKDSLLKDFIETLIKSSGKKTKFLFAAKNPAVISDEITPTWISLNPFSNCEKLSFLNSFKEFNGLPFEEKWEMAEVCGGSPFDLNLFAHNAGTKVERRVILKKLKSVNVPEIFLGELGKNRLELLRSRVLFLDSSMASPLFEAFWQTFCQEQEKDFSEFPTDIKALSQKRMLVATKEPGDEMLRFSVHSVLRDKFVSSSNGSKFLMSEEEIKDRQKLISEFYYALFYAQLKSDPKSSYCYLADCLEYAVLAGNKDDVAEFLDIFLDGYYEHVSNGKVWTLFEDISGMFLKQKDNAEFVKLICKMGQELTLSHPILAEKLLSQWHDHPLADEKEKTLSYETLGQLNLILGNFETSLENFKKYISCDYPEVEKTLGSVYCALGEANQRLGNMQEAVDGFRKSIEWSEKLDEQKKLGEVYRSLGNVYENTKDWGSAIESYELAIKSDEKNEDESGMTESYLLLGKAHLQKESWGDAIKHLATALERGKKSENIGQIENAYNGLANTCERQDQWDQMKGMLLMAVEAIVPSKRYLKKESITLENIRMNRARYNDSDWDSLKDNLPKKLVESLRDGSFQSQREV
jgi:tetratricopeptide (TPR) repeat protein